MEAVGVAGMALTVAEVVPAALLQPATVTTTLYVPVAAVEEFVIDGFCVVDEKLLGPVHA